MLPGGARMPYVGLNVSFVIMDCRVKPGNDGSFRRGRALKPLAATLLKA
jgi:hypothetical protein